MSDQVRDSALQNIAQQLGRLATQGLATTYATGTWVPSLSFGGSITGISLSQAVGSWTQIGREFFNFFRITVATLTSVSGAALISGLQVTATSDQAGLGGGGLLTNFTNMVSLSGSPTIHINGTAATSVQLFMFSATGVISVSAGNFSNSSVIAGNFQFYI